MTKFEGLKLGILSIEIHKKLMEYNKVMNKALDSNLNLCGPIVYYGNISTKSSQNLERDMYPLVKGDMQRVPYTIN